MEEYTYRLTECNFRKGEFPHPVKGHAFAHRVSLYFIRKHPDYRQYEEDDCPEFEEEEVQFTYWGDTFPALDEALAFLKKEVEAVAYGIYAGCDIPNEYRDVTIEDTAKYLQHIDPDRKVIRIDELLLLVEKYQYSLYSVGKLFNGMCSDDTLNTFQIFEDLDELIDWAES